MRRLATVGLAAAVLAPAAHAAGGLTLRTSLEPTSVLFGDPIRAVAAVTIDTRTADPATLSLSLPTGAWTVSERTPLGDVRAGALLERSLELTLVCRSTACVPRGASAVIRLPSAAASVRLRAGARRRVTAGWPPLLVASRLPPGAATAATPPFLLQTTPPRPSERISPSLAAWLLDAGAVALAAAGVALGAIEVWRRTRRRPRLPSARERTLALLREAETRPGPDRRRALSLLETVALETVPLEPAALTTTTSGPPADGLAAAAAAAAWSEREPTPAELAELARRFEEGR